MRLVVVAGEVVLGTHRLDELGDAVPELGGLEQQQLDYKEANLEEKNRWLRKCFGFVQYLG